jgi:uncharacterized Tic20 family protein
MPGHDWRIQCLRLDEERHRRECHGRIQQSTTAMETEPGQNLQPSPQPPTQATTSWRLYLELLALAAFVIPLGQILGPMVLWLVKKDTIPEVDYEGKRVLNFNISWTLWGILTCGLGFIVWFVIAIVAMIKAANREPFIHPLTIDFLK